MLLTLVSFKSLHINWKQKNYRWSENQKQKLKIETSYYVCVCVCVCEGRRYDAAGAGTIKRLSLHTSFSLCRQIKRD